MISGIMISEVALPLMGIQLPQGFGWRRLHDMSANLFLLMLGVHTALHWNWIANTFYRYLINHRPIICGRVKEGCFHMKTLGRIFIILFVFVLLSGLMVAAVDTSG